MSAFKSLFINKSVSSCLSRNSQFILNRGIAYKSSISLENLYPNSSLKLTSPTKPEGSLCDKFSGYIPIDRLDISYTKSSGPGGQNVNKVNTKVNLRFHLESAEWLDEGIRHKLAQINASKISKDGFFILRSDVTRSQQLNLADCLQKLRSLIVEASYVSPPVSEETLERIRRRQERAMRERLMVKRGHSQTKADRRDPNIEL